MKLVNLRVKLVNLRVKLVNLRVKLVNLRVKLVNPREIAYRCKAALPLWSCEFAVPTFSAYRLQNYR